jgi:hypothetical protein
MLNLSESETFTSRQFASVELGGLFFATTAFTPIRVRRSATAFNCRNDHSTNSIPTSAPARLKTSWVVLPTACTADAVLENMQAALRR